MKQFGQEQVATTASPSSGAVEATRKGILAALTEGAPRDGEPASAAAACLGSPVGFDAAEWAECAASDL